MSRSFIRPTRLALIAVLLAVTFPALNARADVVTPHLELRSGTTTVKAPRPKGQPVYLDLGVYVAALGGPFEIWLTRPDYTQPIQIQQAVYAADGTRSFLSLPSDPETSWEGFKDFLHIDVSQAGKPIKSKMLDFCPNSYDRQRVNDEGPDTTSYPEACFSNPFTKGVVWGIDQGWAVNPASSFGASMRLPDGTYDVSVSIDQRYIDLFDVPPATASIDLTMTVRTTKGIPGCPKCPPHHGHPMRYGSGSTLTAVPTVTNPDPTTLPDLVALPAWGITVDTHPNGKEFMSFGATVWTGGAQSMVVEGYRQQGQELMDAYQYFYKDGKPIGRAPVGQMEYDNRRGHKHWHFRQFASYSLLDAMQTEVVKSTKEAFCLAPTDSIDLTLPGADWNPYLGGLGTACGGPTAMWVREVLPLGWGDTYFQGLPGQSFEITDVPNGTYYIKVEANPLGSLFEQSAANNSELREVIIKGKAGSRHVEVPPWNGIDTEGPFQDDGGGRPGA